MNKTLLITLLTLTIFSSHLFSYPTQIPVRSTLSNININCMTEDENGYIWIGTRRGLNRYNGSSYKVYYHSDSLSLANDYISAMYQDTDGRLWIGTSTGLNLLQNGKVVPEINETCSMITSISKCTDNDGLLLMGRNGLYHYNIPEKILTLVFQDSALWGKAVITGNGNIWIYDALRQYIYILDKNYSLFKTIYTRNSTVKGICKDVSGNAIVATDKGLKYFNPDGIELPIHNNLKQITNNNHIAFITNGIGSNIIIGIKDKGFYFFTGSGKDVSRFWNDDKLENVFNGECLVTDDNVFISKNKTDLEYRYFTSDKKIINITEHPEYESLNMFYNLGKDSLLILTNKNAYIKQLDNGNISKIKIDGNKSDDVLSISIFDNKSNFWILRNSSTLCKYRFKDNRMHLLASFTIESTNSIWCDKNDEGVYLLQNNGIIHINDDNSIKLLQTAHYPPFWFCGTTSDGLTYFIDDNDIWYFSKDKRIKKMPFKVKSPECFYKANDGKYWIGSNGFGIYIYNPISKKIDNITVSNGLPDNTTRSITGDLEGNIWVSSRCEVYKVNQKSKHITLMGNPENMNLGYNTNSCLNTNNGHILFGSKYHLAEFREKEETVSNNLNVCIDAIIINGEKIINEESKLEIEHTDNVISFFYSAMNFDPGIKLTYRYKLEGYNDEWVENGTSTVISFSNLPKGKYNLKINVQNSTGIWSTEILEYHFKVKPSFWMSATAIIIYTLISLIILSVVIFQGIHIRRNRKQIQQTEHDKLLAESLSKEKINFFTNISHEYRTPLSLIYGPVKELSKENSLNEHDKYLLSLVVHNTERMMKLTEETLDFYSEKKGLKVVKSNVSVFLRGMIESFEYIFQQNELSVNIEMPDELKAYCDREKIERVFFNIVSNAIKYTPEGGTISIKANIADGNLIIMIADNGIGISTENMMKIFNRYERAGAENNNNTVGFGVGLNYAMELINIHKGLITVSPNLPKGSIFTISVPATKSAYETSEIILDPETSNENPVIPIENSKGIKEYTILVTEDNIELANYIKHLLAEEYNIVIAFNGNEAIEYLKVAVPDIIISDIMMPFKDGLTLCREIKSSVDYSYLPVILLTAKADTDSNIEGLETGADAYIKKPFDPNLLKTTIKNIIENRKRQQNILLENTSSSDKTLDVSEIKINSHDKAFMDKIRNIMEEHISDEDFNVTIMAKEMNISRTSLFSKVKSLYGISPITFITEYRLNRAMELLKTGEYNISEISYKVGFSTLTGFSRSFKNKFGVPPSSI